MLYCHLLGQKKYIGFVRLPILQNVKTYEIVNGSQISSLETKSSLAKVKIISFTTYVR